MSDNSKVLLDSLHNQYSPMVRNMSMGFMKGDIDLANDLTQEVFINIWNAIPAFKGDSSYKTWIYRITVNTCLQHIRKEKNKKQVPLEDISQPCNNVDIPDYGNLYRAIGKLSEIDRLIIMMVLDEAEYEEIAGVVGIHENTLRVKIHRIKNRLKKILKHENGNG